MYAPYDVVTAHYRACSLVAVEVAMSTVLEASTQTDLLRADIALQVTGCRKCVVVLCEAGVDSHLFCRRCVVVELCCQVGELKDEVSMLCSIHKGEQEIDRILSETLQSYPTMVEMQVGSVPRQSVSQKSVGDERWKLVTLCSRRKAPAPPEDLQLKNRFSAFQAEAEPRKCLLDMTVRYLLALFLGN